MPLELIADRPGHAILSEYDEPELAPGEVRVNSLFSSVKHGTELRGFRADTPDASARWDRELGLHRRGELGRAVDVGVERPARAGRHGEAARRILALEQLE